MKQNILLHQLFVQLGLGDFHLAILVHLYCNASLKPTDCRSKYCMASAKVQWRYRKTHGLGAVTYIDLTFETECIHS